MLTRLVLGIEPPELQAALEAELERSDCVVTGLDSGLPFWEFVSKQPVDIVVASRARLPKPVAQTIRSLRSLPEPPEILMLCADATAAQRAGLIAAGCRAVLEPDVSPRQIREVLDSLIADRAAAMTAPLWPGRGPVASPRLADFVSLSPAMQVFMEMVSRMVPSDVSLLILGETGVGKERLARAIHAEGPRSQGPFVAVNCGALPESLLESELFGHVEGAFTGATRDRRGMFELAHHGIIFLDEIGEMPLHLQVKLLRVLQERTIQRLGSETSVPVDVRVLAASNRDLEAGVQAGQFRKDLYYRLSVVTATIPPLRERREDIPELVASYLEHLRPRVGRQISSITDDALEAMQRYDWPGNVRELINVLERGMLLCDTEITLRDLPAVIRGGPLAGPADARSMLDRYADWRSRPLREVRAQVLQDFERAYLSGLLEDTGGRIGECARRAGIEPRSLYEKMKRLGLRKEAYRPPKRP